MVRAKGRAAMLPNPFAYTCPTRRRDPTPIDCPMIVATRSHAAINAPKGKQKVNATAEMF
jgi:hypothetical protein